MAAFHRAFVSELRAIVGSLPIEPNMRVVDVGCGDGFYLGLLAERLSALGRLWGLDINPAFLKLAESDPALQAARCPVQLIAGSVSHFPIEPASCDFVWCAQSLYSLPEPVSALAQMAAALRPGGWVAVLENDTLHQLLLPWPSELEIALRTAEFVALTRQSRRPGKYYVGRRLPAVFAAAGLEPVGFRTQCIDRMAPLDTDLEAFLRSYLDQLAQRVRPHLDPQVAADFAARLEPGGPRDLLREPHFTMSWLNVLALGRRPI
jgi:SAM-dependent methyltransferase